jgi:hypothetical protein
MGLLNTPKGSLRLYLDATVLQLDPEEQSSATDA